MGAGMPACETSTLQAASTRCALLGSGAALVDVLIQEPGQRQPPWLELAAMGLIATSLLLEAETFRRRHFSRARRESPAPKTSEAAASSARRPWSQLLLLLGTAALGMGACTALGSRAALRLGIVPRTLTGLPGVVFGCFVHLSWRHYAVNTLALLLLGPCVLRAAPLADTLEPHSQGVWGVAPFAAASAFIALSSGFCVWALARPAVHAGASGVVWGYVGLLLALTLRQRDVPVGSLLMVLGVVVCYGSVVLLSKQAAGSSGLLLYEACTSRTTSAEQHTFGFLSGLASALFFCRPCLRGRGGGGQ